jgi:hypothetical protein
MLLDNLAIAYFLKFYDNRVSKYIFEPVQPMDSYLFNVDRIKKMIENIILIIGI